MMYSRERSLREQSLPSSQRRKNPSFSSSLLDAIYRSIDEDSTAGDDGFSCYREKSMRKKQSNFIIEEEEDVYEHDFSSLRREIMVEKWTEKKRVEKNPGELLNSASNSSDSSSGGGAFSSSETDTSNYKTRTTTSCFTPMRSKPFRTRVSSTKLDDNSKVQMNQDGKGGSFAKTKQRALKMYGDLTKSKDHPVSPGRRIATFLNSLFNAKKEKLCFAEATRNETRSQRKPKSSSPTTSLSAPSFSRSCLSKTPTSADKLNNGGTKRSVRFYPEKMVSATPLLNEELKNNVKHAREILKGYQEKKVQYRFQAQELRGNGEDDDVESCASSDLFEIENLIEIGRYREELPVYETTNLKTNQAIAHGFVN